LATGKKGGISRRGVRDREEGGFGQKETVMRIAKGFALISERNKKQQQER